MHSVTHVNGTCHPNARVVPHILHMNESWDLEGPHVIGPIATHHRIVTLGLQLHKNSFFLRRRDTCEDAYVPVCVAVCCSVREQLLSASARHVRSRARTRAYLFIHLCVCERGEFFPSSFRRVQRRTRISPLCCSVLQCAAVCCSVLQSVAMCCRVLRCVAVRCSVLQGVAVRCIVLQCVAVCCSMLQCVVVYCNVLQCVAVCYTRTSHSIRHLRGASDTPPHTQKYTYIYTYTRTHTYSHTYTR